jgi:SAM-dependent methyltransferase
MAIDDPGNFRGRPTLSFYDIRKSTMRKATMAEPLFDSYATEYDQALAKSLAASGEGRDYFARGRVDWLARRLHGLHVEPASVLDFGCGDGFTVPLLKEGLGARAAVGVDVSDKSLAVARERHADADTTYTRLDVYQPTGDHDLAYCNGVFHHIPLAERARAVTMVRDSLRPNGLFSLWENNPWNPATVYVMSQCEFDKDAITLSPPETRQLLRAGGFKIVCTDFRFIFPRGLRMFRKLEDVLFGVPLGTQYQVLAQRA